MNIRWEERRYSVLGFVGGLQLFTIAWGTKRDDPQPWKLTSTLPIRFKYAGGTTQEAAQEAAEHVLWLFAQRLGVKFTEGE